jgi:(1->4)-alpha-D-glucan 1-alpha-D-glucosylmutase
VLSQSIAEFVAEIAPDAAANSLGAKLVQLTMVGVPDVYQGCEFPAFSLVDPDNRRPVDFPRIRSVLSQLDASDDTRLRADLAGDYPGALELAKLLVTSRALRLRHARPEWFAGEYLPVPATGAAAAHAVAFQRGGQAVTVVTRLPVRLRAQGGWGDTALRVPAAGSVMTMAQSPASAGWLDVLTGAVYPGDRVPLAELTRVLPVALLVPQGE